MADLARIKRNVAKMAGAGAPETDIDGYIASEGVTVDDVRNFKAAAPASMQDQVRASIAPLSPHNNPSLGDTLNAFQAGAHQGMTLGFGDEINAGLGAIPRAIGSAVTGNGFDLGKAYGEGLEDTQAYIDERTSKAPNAALIGELTGGIATGGTLAKGGLTLMKPAMSVPSAMVRGGVEGATYGGVSGFGNSDADNLQDRAGDALEGAYWGAGTGGVVGGIGAKASGAGSKAAVPSVDDLRARATDLYDQANSSGVTFPQAEVKQLADDIAARAISEGIDPTLHPGATAALGRLQDAAKTGMTVKDAQTMRRIIAAAGKDPFNPDQGRIASIMREMFDKVTTSKTPELAVANALYASAKKASVIDGAIQKAQDAAAASFSTAGLDTAIRQQFKNLLNSKTALRGFSADEVAAIRKVAHGGPIENVARYLGKLAPTGAVSLMAGGGAPFMVGNAVGGPAVGAAAAGATMATGMGAKAVASALTKRSAYGASMLARNGGVRVPKVQMTPQQLAVARALIAAGGTEGGQLPFRVPELTMAR